jgi:hypothetical protein
MREIDRLHVSGRESIKGALYLLYRHIMICISAFFKISPARGIIDIIEVKLW